MKISVVVPAFNEAMKIERDLIEIAAYLKDNGNGEILVVDDGSTDHTAAIVRQFRESQTKGSPSVNLLSYGSNRGKGYAVRYGVSHSRGKYVAFMDSGLCVPMKYIDVGIRVIESGADIAIGSRRMRGARVHLHQPLYRRWGSVVFWRLMRHLMGLEHSDTQCGFKVYRGDVARSLFSRLQVEGFMFDIEALRTAKRMGLKVAEFPVEWSNDSDTRYRPVTGTIRNLSEIIGIRLRELRSPS